MAVHWMRCCEPDADADDASVSLDASSTSRGRSVDDDPWTTTQPLERGFKLLRDRSYISVPFTRGENRFSQQPLEPACLDS